MLDYKDPVFWTLAFTLHDLDLVEHEYTQEKEKKTNIFSFTESRNRIINKIKFSFHLEGMNEKSIFIVTAVAAAVVDVVFSF
jgi:hypothetical protein